MDKQYTWIFIIIGIFILFFLLSNTIYITTSNVQTPINSCGVSTYGCCPDKITTKMDSSGYNCQKPVPPSSSMMPGSTAPILPIQPTSPPSSGIIPTPYVGQNVANTTPYPPNSILIPIPIPTQAQMMQQQQQPLADQQMLPPKKM